MVRPRADGARATWPDRVGVGLTSLCRWGWGWCSWAGARCRDHFTRLLADAEPFDDVELQMLIRNGLGQSLVASGRVVEGLRRLDEVMVASPQTQRSRHS